MTDNEIIKALECCTNEGFQDCENCPLNKPHQPCKKTLLPQITLNLVNRQKAEIERLEGWQDLLKAEKHSLIKAEAVKEFAERLKKMHRNNKTSVVSLVTVFDNINNLVKEMVGEG